MIDVHSFEVYHMGCLWSLFKGLIYMALLALLLAGGFAGNMAYEELFMRLGIRYSGSRITGGIFRRSMRWRIVTAGSR